MKNKTKDGLLQIFIILFIVFFVLALWLINSILLFTIFGSLACIFFVIVILILSATKTARTPQKVKPSRGQPW